MDELSNHLRAAVVAPPPTRIDVDRLIEADRRRRHHRAWTLAGTGVAAAVAVVAVTPALVTGSAREGQPPRPPAAGSPSASRGGTAGPCAPVVVPSPSVALQSYGTMRTLPTEPPDRAAERLTRALSAALRAELSPGTTVTGVLPKCPGPRFQYHDRYREYGASGWLVQDGRRGHFSVALRARAAGAPPGCQPPDVELPDCTERTFEDGTVAVTRTYVDDGRKHRTAEVNRSDGTWALVATGNYQSELWDRPAEPDMTADEPLLTLDQLVALGRSPALTLYP